MAIGNEILFNNTFFLMSTDLGKSNRILYLEAEESILTAW